MPRMIEESDSTVIVQIGFPVLERKAEYSWGRDNYGAWVVYRHLYRPSPFGPECPGTREDSVLKRFHTKPEMSAWIQANLNPSHEG